MRLQSILAAGAMFMSAQAFSSAYLCSSWRIPDGNLANGATEQTPAKCLKAPAFVENNNILTGIETMDATSLDITQSWASVEDLNATLAWFNLKTEKVGKTGEFLIVSARADKIAKNGDSLYCLGTNMSGHAPKLDKKGALQCWQFHVAVTEDKEGFVADFE